MPKQSGFSLLELLVALTIVAILSAIAYPNYQAHVLKTRRAEAKVALMDLAARLEQYRLIHHSYKGATLSDLGKSPATEKNHYRLKIETTTENYYVIAAIPKGPQVKDTRCGTLTYKEQGEKGITGSGTTVECW